MARTKASACRKSSGAKAPRKAIASGGTPKSASPSHTSKGSVSSKKAKGFSGKNAFCQRATPEWQKKITLFMSNKPKEESLNSDAEDDDIVEVLPGTSADDFETPNGSGISREVEQCSDSGEENAVSGDEKDGLELSPKDQMKVKNEVTRDTEENEKRQNGESDEKEEKTKGTENDSDTEKNEAKESNHEKAEEEKELTNDSENGTDAEENKENQKGELSNGEEDHVNTEEKKEKQNSETEGGIEDLHTETKPNKEKTSVKRNAQKEKKGNQKRKKV